MAIDRDDTLRKAEKLLRQGKLEAAIAEYARVVEDQPRDWNTANLLGDLFVRSGQVDRAVAQFARIADQLAREGFVSKATALYKKIVKIHPEDDTALLRAAELALQQGLGADARGYLQSLFQQRLRRGDRPGAAKIAVKLADVDRGDAVGRLEAARLLAEIGDASAAADQLRVAGETLCGAGKVGEGIRAWREALRFNPADALTRSLMVQAHLDLGDPDAARDAARQAGDLRAVADGYIRAGREADALGTLEQALASEPDSEILRVAVAQTALRLGEVARARDAMLPLAHDPSPGVQMVLAEIDLRCRQFAQAASALDLCLASAQDLSAPLEALAVSFTPHDPDAGFAVIAALIRRTDATGDVESAIAALERFVAAAPAYIEALEQLVRSCEGPFHKDQQYRARVQLADAYLAAQRWADARSLCEYLVAQRPEQVLHHERLARALEGLGQAAEAPFAPRDPEPPLASAGLLDLLASLPASPPLEEPRVDDRRELGSPPTSPRAITPEATESFDLDVPQDPPTRLEVYEIDLSGDLENLLTEATGPFSAGPAWASTAVPDEGDSLEEVFHKMRESSGRDVDAAAAARAYDRASEHYNTGNREAADACLREAVRDVSHRFRAASMLARLARERGAMLQAVEWLERASESPAPSLQASQALLYELADTLESAGEPARALAVFLELQSSAPAYRDLAERIGALSDPQANGTAPGRGAA